VEARACRELAALDQISERAAAIGIDVELVDLVDVRVERRRELPLKLGRDRLPFGFELVECVVGGDEVPGDDRVGDEVQAGSADALAVEGGEAELAVVAVDADALARDRQHARAAAEGDRRGNQW
jgi:hypothetical protein